MENKIKAIIFDMNGIIVDDEALHETAFRKVLVEQNFELSTNEYMSVFFGKTDKDGFISFFSKHKVINYSIDELLKRKSDLYHQEAKNNLKAFPGIIEFINKVANIYPLALASNSIRRDIEIVLNFFNIKDKFKSIVSCEEVKNGKPDPEIYFISAKKLNINPNECLVIEDSPTGIASAKAAGMKCLAVTNSYSEEKLKDADIIIDSFVDFNIENL